ncbi:N-acetyltransferase [Acrocarpospora phusangensis]|uniref:N-acetyltransferase n=1 Tax=Acrocarpospora phusangensis TaxID=1070424 RepID=A0A919QF97_9ACTN|nr:GNAT family N-acetyltransferase [Acrocarpospora phusangensis]GIH25435.1 N-acetyltransferase [Acrocarpospora phusangensis]
MTRATVADNPGAQRYEILVDGGVAGFAQYRLRPGKIVFTHTEIDAAYEGKGLGSSLARAALEAVRERGLAVAPVCPFFAGYIKRHPEYADLVAADYQDDIA